MHNVAHNGEESFHHVTPPWLQAHLNTDIASTLLVFTALEPKNVK